MVRRIGGRDSWQPRRVVLLQCLKDWIGRLLSRPGIEDILTSYPYHFINTSKPGEVMSDIWGSSTILKLKGSNGQPFFKYHKDNEEIRLLFGLAGDGYNPFRNLIAKQKVTSLGFWITVLNFPPNQQYQFNNVFYLGSLPPKNPPVGRYHPIISVIRDTLQEFWDPGVYFTRTSKYPNGRPAKGMLAPSASDMLAARAIYGFTSATSGFFCMSCPMTLEKIEDVDLKNWGRWDFEAHKKHAFEWKEAQTAGYEAWHPIHATPRTTILRSPSLRCYVEHEGGDGSGPQMEGPAVSKKNWLSLQNNLRELLAMFKNHFGDGDAVVKILKEPCATYRNLWYLCSAFRLRVAGNAKQRRLFIRRILQKMSQHLPEEVENLVVPEAEKPPVSIVNDLEEAENRLRETFQSDAPNISANEVEDCIGVLRHIYHGNKVKSITQTKPAFINLCHIMQVKDRQGVPYLLSTEDTRQQMYDALHAHQAMTLPALKGSRRTGAILGKDVMDNIRVDMNRTILPNWVSPVPHNWGTTERGKLTESQWKVLFTVHLLITLIWRWHNETGRLKDILHNILLLVTIIEITSLKETSPRIAEVYKVNYKKYMEGILDLFKEDTITPIIHVAGHVGDNLQDLGPSYSRGAQFYERFIHLLQQTKMNHKSGEMEETFLRSQAHAANLMSLIEGNEEIRSQAAKAVKAIQRDTNQGDEGLALATLYNLKLDDDLQGRNYQLGPLSNEENQLLKTRLAEKYNTMDDDAPEGLMVHELRDITIEIVRYAQMGIIQNIIRIPIRDPPEFSGWDTYLIVQLFPRPTQKSATEDPYATWQKLLSLELKLELNIPGCLYPPMDANPCRVIIEPEDIQSHIAYTVIAPDLVHIRPTSRHLRSIGIEYALDNDSEQSEEP
ncbi:hypothetical protein GGX14DRAFT_577655 [Mycena pura]|uniref:Uncharacterized protein n=1 Tax=Mycena pura TaxID=153505 RepID=A0AAD6URM3_9AGAR|nr:hypothetical protein GGX14DRAFT_577655 [Mycena pura]